MGRGRKTRLAKYDGCARGDAQARGQKERYVQNATTCCAASSRWRHRAASSSALRTAKPWRRSFETDFPFFFKEFTSPAWSTGTTPPRADQGELGFIHHPCPRVLPTVSMASHSRVQFPDRPRPPGQHDRFRRPQILRYAEHLKVFESAQLKRTKSGKASTTSKHLGTGGFRIRDIGWRLVREASSAASEKPQMGGIAAMDLRSAAGPLHCARRDTGVRLQLTSRQEWIITGLFRFTRQPPPWVPGWRVCVVCTAHRGQGMLAKRPILDVCGENVVGVDDLVDVSFVAEMRWRWSWEAVVVGVGVCIMWIALDHGSQAHGAPRALEPQAQFGSDSLWLADYRVRIAARRWWCRRWRGVLSLVRVPFPGAPGIHERAVRRFFGSVLVTR